MIRGEWRLKPFQYADERIGLREIVFLLPSYIHGVVLLTEPRLINKVTHSSDGWIPLIAGGMVTIVFAWITAKLAIRFPGKTFIEYASQLVTKPVAYAFAAMIAAHFIIITSFEVAAIGGIAQIYLLPRTPYEVSAFIFLLIIVYAVSGSRVGLLRLNLLFYPIYISILIITHLFSLGNFEIANIKPMFITDIPTLMRASGDAIMAFVGSEILLLYTYYSHQQKKVPMGAVCGMIITVSVLVFSYIIVIGAMGVKVPEELVFPTIDLVKEVVIPGGIFERADVVFFVIWTMSIFNTAAIAFDAILIALGYMFPKIRKTVMIFILSPVIFFIAMQPPTLMEVLNLLKYDIYLQISLTFVIPPLLLTVAAVRKLPKRGETD
ncbi:MAG: spore gernimation protein [Paenibacillus sp.]|nr:spore gernimation protein [Paenibacillus sp.]